MAATDKRIQEHAKECYRNARRVMGHGWAQVGSEIQEALVMREVLHLAIAQDETISAETVRDTMTRVYLAVRKILDEKAVG